MAMNPIQFQPGLSMAEFIHLYGTEAKCRRALYRTRFNRRFRLRALVPRLARAMTLCGPCPERLLRMACNFDH